MQPLLLLHSLCPQHWCALQQGDTNHAAHSACVQILQAAEQLEHVRNMSAAACQELAEIRMGTVDTVWLLLSIVSEAALHTCQFAQETFPRGPQKHRHALYSSFQLGPDSLQATHHFHAALASLGKADTCSMTCLSLHTPRANIAWALYVPLSFESPGAEPHGTCSHLKHFRCSSSHKGKCTTSFIQWRGRFSAAHRDKT